MRLVYRRIFAFYGVKIRFEIIYTHTQIYEEIRILIWGSEAAKNIDLWGSKLVFGICGNFAF